MMHLFTSNYHILTTEAVFPISYAVICTINHNTAILLSFFLHGMSVTKDALSITSYKKFEHRSELQHGNIWHHTSAYTSPA